MAEKVPAARVATRREPKPSGLPRRPLILATVLTALAGFLDAAGYVELNHLYVSFMSGNSTHLGMSLPTGNLADIFGILAIVGAFVAGACGGTWISDHGGANAVVLNIGGEVLLLFSALVLSSISLPHIALFLVAAAMGMQNSLHQIVAGADVGRGFITGVLFSLGQSLARMKNGDGQGRRALSSLFSWSAFVLGAVAGAFSLSYVGLVACLGMAVTVAVVVMICLQLRLL